MGSSPQACKICCFKNTNVVQGLPVQIYDNIDNKYITQPNYSSLIFLQIKIKKYLHRKKSLSNSNLIKLKAINTLKSNSSSNNNIIDNKVPKILNYNITTKNIKRIAAICRKIVITHKTEINSTKELHFAAKNETHARCTGETSASCIIFTKICILSEIMNIYSKSLDILVCGCIIRI